MIPNKFLYRTCLGICLSKFMQMGAFVVNHCLVAISMPAHGAFGGIVSEEPKLKEVLKSMGAPNLFGKTKRPTSIVWYR